MINKIVIVNYGVGNLRSVKKAFEKAGAEVEISNDIEEIKAASKLVLPGVGNFKVGMSKLLSSGLVDVLKEQVQLKKKPILGICLGMQLMTKRSEEGNIEGLNWIEAETLKFKIDYKVPHIGWNTLKNKSIKLLENIDDDKEFYFTHSYYVKVLDEKIPHVKTKYGIDFHSGFQFENIYGFQFHPEKSYEPGIKLIQNFINI